MTEKAGFLIIIFLVPLVFEITNVLTLWLGENYPQHTEEFCILALISNYIEALSAPLWMVVYAQSNIKRYQIMVSLIFSLIFLGSWGVLALDAKPYIVMLVRILVFFILLMARLHYLKFLLPQFQTKQWFYNVVLKGFIIILIALMPTYLVSLSNLSNLFLHIALTTISSLIFSSICIFFIGLEKQEQAFCINKIKKIFKKSNNLSQE